MHNFGAVFGEFGETAVEGLVSPPKAETHQPNEDPNAGRVDGRAEMR